MDRFKTLEELAQPYITENCSVFKSLVDGFVCKKEDDFDGVYIEGYASTFKNTDRHGDVIIEGAFDETLKILKKAKKLPMMIDHKYSVDTMVGSWFDFKVDTVGIFMRGRISRTDKTAHLIKLVEDNAIDTVSIGGMMKYEGQDKKGNNRIIQIMLLETSIIPIPANDRAKFEMKSLFEEKHKQVSEEKASGLSVEQEVEEIMKKLKQKGVIK